MRYTKTIDANAITQNSRLQVGQWVNQCGVKGQFCGIRPSGSIVVAWQGNMNNHKDKRGYFKALTDYAKSR